MPLLFRLPSWNRCHMRPDPTCNGGTAPHRGFSSLSIPEPGLPQGASGLRMPERFSTVMHVQAQDAPPSDQPGSRDTRRRGSVVGGSSHGCATGLAEASGSSSPTKRQSPELRWEPYRERPIRLPATLS